MDNGGTKGIVSIRLGEHVQDEEASEDMSNPPNVTSTPLKILVLSELLPRTDYALSVPPRPRPLRLFPEEFDGLLDELRPSWVLPVADPLLEGKTIDIRVTWSQWSDLKPSRIVEENPSLRGLVDINKGAEAGITHSDLVALIHRALGNRAQRLVDVLEATSARAPKVPEDTRTLPKAKSSGVPSLFDLVDFPSLLSPEREPTTNRGIFLSEVQRLFADILCAALAHPEYRRLERAWRGLRLVSDQVRDRGATELYVVPCEEFATVDNVPDLEHLGVDVIAIDLTMAASARSLNWCREWADAAAELQAPVVVGVDASWLGQPDLGQTRIYQHSDGPEFLLLRTLSQHENARWLALSTNNAWIREAYTLPAKRLGIDFQQPATEVESFALAGAPMVVTALIARAQSTDGEPFGFFGDASGVLSGFAVRQMRAGAVNVSIAVEAPAPSQLQADLSDCGLCTLGHVSNRDSVTLAYAPTAARQHRGAGTLGSPEATIADQIAVGRLSRVFAQSRSMFGLERDAQRICEGVRQLLASVFVNPRPAGPEIDVRLEPHSRRLTAIVRPRRHRGLTLEEFQLSQQWS